MLTQQRRAGLLLAGLVVVWSVQPAALADDARTVRLKLGTYNVEYFFDRHDDPYTDDDNYPAKPEEALAAVAETIRGINVDFLALQEVENQGVLDDFNRRFLPEMNYRFAWVNQRSGEKAINLAFLSRVPIGDVTVHAFDEFSLPGEIRRWSFVRQLVRVTLAPAEDMTLHVYMVHFKAQSGSTADDPKSAKWRLAEARQVHARVAALLREDPSAWVAVIGDVNDLPDSPPCLALTRPEDDVALIDAHAGLPPEQRDTLLRQSSYQLVDPHQPVDYIFVSPELAEHLVSESVSTPLPMDPKASDHAPLTAAFDLPLAGTDGASTDHE